MLEPLNEALTGRYRLVDELGEEHVLEGSGRHPWILLVVGLAHGLARRQDEALAIYDEVVARSKAEFVQPMLLLLLANGLGLRQEAARLVTLGGKERDMTFPVLLLYFNEARGLSETPEALEVLRQMGWHDEVERLS